MGKISQSTLMILATAVLGIAAIVAFGVVTGLPDAGFGTDHISCRDATDRFEFARADLRAAIQLYNNCVPESDGRNDCSNEAARVQWEQSHFEFAVSEYESQCIL